jgi:phage anti-repressor protein
MPNANADVREFSQNAAGPPAGIGGYRGDEERQLSRDLEQRLTDAQELRRLLDRNSTQMKDLDRVIESLRRAREDPDYGNAEQITRLKAAIDYMRKVELDLVRELERVEQIEKYFLAEDNEAPSNYHKLVEEYYKSIAKSK